MNFLTWTEASNIWTKNWISFFLREADNYAPRYVDKLVKVFRKSGSEEWILIHIEVQGYTDEDFARRMFQYYYRILDQYYRSITAFAIFTDGNKAFHPKAYKAEFLGTGIHYWYNTYKIIDQNDAELEASNNPFALAVLSAKLVAMRTSKNDQQLFDQAFDLARRLLTKQIPREKIRKVFNFLRYYLRFENQEMFTKFEQQISILTERNTKMGIDEFLLAEEKREVRENALKEVALNMKKSGLDVNLIANITGLSISDIEDLLKNC